MEEVFASFANIVDEGTDAFLFSAATWKAADAVLSTTRDGYVEDVPGVALYAQVYTDTDGLPIFLCFRGSSKNESVHQKLVPVLGRLQNVAPEMLETYLLNWMHRHNTRAAVRNSGAQERGHYDVLLLDEVQSFEEIVLKERGGVTMKAYIRSDAIDSPPLVCGVTTLSTEMRLRSGLPPSDQTTCLLH